MNMQATIPSPLGGEIYSEVADRSGKTIELTYNDLWMLIVCRTALDSDWPRAREAAGMVVDPTGKRAIVDRLWRLDQDLDGLPSLPDAVVKLNLQRAHVWFNERKVSNGKSW